MKINKNELHSMINQIDDDLLKEAEEGYEREKSHMLQRIIPVAACIFLMIAGTVGAALKNGIVEQTDSGVGNATGVLKATETTVWKNVKKIDISDLSVREVLEKLNEELTEPEYLHINSLSMEISKDVQIMDGSIEVTNVLTNENFLITLTEREAGIEQAEESDIENPIQSVDVEEIGGDVKKYEQVIKLENWSTFSKSGVQIEEIVKSYMEKYDVIELSVLFSQEEIISEVADIYLEYDTETEVESEVTVEDAQNYTNALLIKGRNYEDTAQLYVMLLY